MSVNQNDQMKKISAWAAVVVVPTLIAGIYGMNFDYMPELHWRYGYVLALSLMVLISFALYRNFKRTGCSDGPPSVGYKGGLIPRAREPRIVYRMRPNGGFLA